jgi:hypothetical protein
MSTINQENKDTFKAEYEPEVHIESEQSLPEIPLADPEPIDPLSKLYFEQKYTTEDIGRIVKEFTSLLNDVPDLFDQCFDAYRFSNRALDDMDHTAELANSNASRSCVLWKMFGEIRERRREFDNMIKVMKPLLEFRKQNATFSTKLNKVDREVFSTIKSLDNRVYIPRALEHLPELQKLMPPALRDKINQNIPAAKAAADLHLDSLTSLSGFRGEGHGIADSANC